MWLTHGVNPQRAASLAARLDVGLGSPGVCHACLSIVAMDLDDERETGRSISAVAPMLWAEGLHAPVRAALERAAASDVADAADGVTDLDRHGCRSRLFRAVVRRLAVELEEDVRRAYRASLN